jgi:hypothetical protein
MDQDRSSFVAQIDAVVHVYRSSGQVYAIGDWGGGTIALAAALPIRRDDRWVVRLARPQSVRLSGCDADLPISRAVDNRRRVGKASKAQVDRRSANSWIRFPLGPVARGT